MTAPRREITPEELEVVFQLAAAYPDLRNIPEILADLESRCKTLTGLVVGQEVAPRNIDDLLKLRAVKLVSDEWIKARLGIIEVTAVEVAAPETREVDPATHRDYVVKDRRSVAA
jgi:hypothetical protein